MTDDADDLEVDVDVEPMGRWRKFAILTAASVIWAFVALGAVSMITVQVVDDVAAAGSTTSLAVLGGFVLLTGGVWIAAVYLARGEVGIDPVA